MITTSLTTRSTATTLRAPLDDVPVTGHDSPDDAHDAGWLGQVPPPSPPAARPATCAPTDALLGSDSVRDHEEAGWLGQVPPAPTRCEDPAPPRAEDPPVTGYVSPEEAREQGWLGQVPPPLPRTPEVSAPAEPDYAVPGLAPDPWNAPGTLYPSDPTLFG